MVVRGPMEAGLPPSALVRAPPGEIAGFRSRHDRSHRSGGQKPAAEAGVASSALLNRGLNVSFARILRH